MKLFRALKPLVAALLVGLPLSAAANPYEQNLSLRVIPGWRDASGVHVAGLELSLAQGWHTYWRSPGDAGIPPQFTWAGSDNVARLNIRWPRPQVFDQNGLRTVGYKGRVVLPLEIHPGTKGQMIALRGHVLLGICEEICVPLEITFAADLSAAKARRDPAIAAAIADTPMTARQGRVSDVRCAVSPTDQGLALNVRVALPSTGGRETLIVESGDPRIWVAPSTTIRNGKNIETLTELVHNSGAGFALDRSGLVITVLGKNHAVEIHGCPAG